MKNFIKLLFFICVLFWIQTTFAASNPVWDYTYVDCEWGSDLNGEVFNKQKPFNTLKAWIEQSINYLNQKWMTLATGSWLAYTSFQYSVFVKWWCYYNWNISNFINLDFKPDNNSTLLIAWINGNFLIDNVYFNFPRAWDGGVTFRNANFTRNETVGFYFNGFVYWWDVINWPLVRVINWMINVNNWKQITNFNESRGWYSNYWRRNASFRFWWISIEWSLINLYVNNNYAFRMPVYLKDNKINIKNSNTDGNKYNLYFYVSWNNRDWYNYWTTNFISNEIDMAWNNFYTENYNTVFVNNKFSNVKNFIAWSDDTTPNKLNTFINNYIQSTNKVNISNNTNAINNLFVNWFIDTSDSDNFKRNFSWTSSQEKWIGWIFRKELSSTQIIYTDYKTIYKEVTWQDYPLDNSSSSFVIN